MKRLILTLALAVLVLPAAASAKGPSAAMLDGPGADGGISFRGGEGSVPLGNLTQQSGWFEAAFGQEPSPLLTGRPQGDLGPRYAVTYTVPGGSAGTHTIRQEIYPYATSGPVTYMPPGQPIFDMETRGGWFQAGPELRDTLVAAGLPARAPTGSSDGVSLPALPVSILALALLFVSATAVVLRRRARPAAA